MIVPRSRRNDVRTPHPYGTERKVSMGAVLRAGVRKGLESFPLGLPQKLAFCSESEETYLNFVVTQNSKLMQWQVKARARGPVELVHHVLKGASAERAKCAVTIPHVIYQPSRAQYRLLWRVVEQLCKHRC